MRFLMIIVFGLFAAACSSTDNTGGGASTSATPSANAGASTGGVTAAPGTQAHLEQTTSSDRVFFAYDQHTLSAEARTQVARWADWMRDNPSARLLVEGHADERGTTDYNFALGARRSFAVKSALEGMGISGGRIETTAFGELRPAVQGSSEAAWAQNRRAVVVVQGGASS